MQVLLGLSLVNEVGGKVGLLPLTTVFTLSHLQDHRDLAADVTATWIAALREHSAGFGGLMAQWRDNRRLLEIGPICWTAYERAVALGDSSDALLFGRVHLMYLDVVGYWDEMLTLSPSRSKFWLVL